ncbi:uncharacterized protein LOC129003336 [Macrosteles quadrilineatus]|uniref:uncharacterized protein LOC128985348 n=1 Tax=Macrosteles quadrilineatus TaxID=74068 RepID=UPI0023E2868E|nr:uncharacterized protein LOC128985348 [Macrosteles quadrilineatus]XP_054287604.1 uncharacterized protein LOC129003336 [Macrosteles quadrilineatus]
MNYTPRSLKLLEMPYLCKKLGINTTDYEKTTGSINYGYNSKVLVGNWEAERLGPGHLGEGGTMVFETTYNKDYRCLKGDQNSQDLWTNRIRNMGTMDTQDGENSMVTIYDLAFRCRVRDFVSGDYGNITGYGKKECLRHYWDATLNKEKSCRFNTEYREAFS